MRTTVYIIRHAEAEGNVYRRCHGQYNALLTTRAYKQLPYLAKRFENVPLAAVYSSDLFRALQTAHAFADMLGLDVTADARLRERSFGQWEGMTRDEIRAEHADAYDSWRVHAGGELVFGVEPHRHRTARRRCGARLGARHQRGACR